MPDEMSAVEVTIQVAEENGMLIARVRFENRGDKPYLIKRGLNGYGRKELDANTKPGSMMDEEFKIMCGENRVRYIGPITRWGPLRRSAFDPINPGEVIDTRRIRIDDLYRFPEGAYNCSILHRHYQFDEESDESIAVFSRPASFTYSR